MKVEGKAKGGIARAKRLSKAERTKIAKNAAAARWDNSLPQVVCGSPDRPLQIGEAEIQCYVLEDGTRVLSQSGFMEALGRNPKPNYRKDLMQGHVSPILQGKALSPFVTEDLIRESRPILFRLPTGVRASGYKAELLPRICEVYLQARDANLLASSQVRIAKHAEILIRGLATVGIIALVDEVTGFQELRAKNALASILEAYIAKELQAWIQTFPDDFYRQLFRLRGLRYPDDSVKRPQYFGKLTNDIVYRRLAPGVLDELKKVTPRSATTGRLKSKYFQRLTSNFGYPKLREHLGSVVTLMKLSDAWSDFANKLDRIHPKYNSMIPLPLDSDLEYDSLHDDGQGL